MSSSEQVTYCFKWNFRRQRAGTPLTAAEARDLDATGDEYTAVVPAEKDGNPPVLVTVVWKNDFVGVTFLDEAGRKNVEYSFYKKNNGNLFLENVSMWTYPDNNPRLRLNEATVQENIQYREDGYVNRVTIDKVENVKETKEYTDIPMDRNWEPVPSFGDYRSIARFER